MKLSLKLTLEKEDTDAILQIVQYMQPLINKYAKNSYLAEYEDMQQELCLALIDPYIKFKKLKMRDNVYNILQMR